MGNEDYYNDVPLPTPDYPDYYPDNPNYDVPPLPIPDIPNDYYYDNPNYAAPLPDNPNDYYYEPPQIDYYEPPQMPVGEEVDFRYVVSPQTGNVFFDFQGQPLYYDENNYVRDSLGEYVLDENGNPCTVNDFIQREEEELLNEQNATSIEDIIPYPNEDSNEEATLNLDLWGKGDINPTSEISIDEDYEPQSSVTVNPDEVTFVGTDYVTNSQGQTIREDVFALENKDEFYDRLFQNLQADISFSAYTVEQYKEEMKSKNPYLMAKLSTNIDTNEQTVNVLAVENDNIVKVPLSQTEKKSLTQLTNEILEMIDTEEEKIKKSQKKGMRDYD